MQDVRVTKGERPFFDLSIDGSDFASVDGFGTAIATSLFSNDRAPSSNVPEASRRGGWIGNIFDIENPLGSTLWLYKQSRLDSNTPNLVALAARSALSWLVTDGLAKSVDATAEKYNSTTLLISIVIVENNGAEKKIQLLWSLTSASNIS